MSFFYVEKKKEARTAPKRVDARNLPVQSLNRLGCSVCPRDKDRLDTPKMLPQGSPGASLYVLNAAPTMEDDSSGEWMRDKVGRAIIRMIPRGTPFRAGGVIQCATDDRQPGSHEVECCRQRVVSDIEETRPLVVMGVGDAPLAWATGLQAYAPRWRGQLIQIKVGSHVCWYYPVSFPNYIIKESKYGPSEHEPILRHDIEQLCLMLDSERTPLPEHEYYAGPYDAGVECITGDQPGDLARLEAGLQRLLAAPRLGVDLETTALRPYNADSLILTAAVGTFEDTIAFPLDHPDGWPSDKHRRQAWSMFVEFLLFSQIKEAHHLGFEMEWLAFFVDPRILRLTEWDDTMAMAHTLCERSGTHSLGAQTRVRYGFDLKAQSTVDVSRPKWWTVYSVKDTLRYNGMDAKWCNRLSRTLRPIIATDPRNQWAHDRKVRLASTLVLTQLKGLPVDLEYAQKMEVSVEGKLKGIEARIQRCPEVLLYTKRIGTFSPSNNDHVLALLKKICERDEVGESVDEEVMNALPVSEVPCAPLVLEHRGLSKLLSTNLKPITTGRIVADDGRIHSVYSSMRAETGRLSAEDPNVQNWPVRQHREVRGIISVEDRDRQARVRRWLLACDYGQIEFRVAGMASEDSNLVKYSWTGYDVHGHWANRVVEEYGEIKDHIVSTFGVDWDEKGMKTLRQEAKNKWVFPSIFGAAVHSRAAGLGIPRDIAQELDREFWDEFPGVKKWQKWTVQKYEKNLYVETLGGIRRHGPLTVNQIINAPIQGTAAEIVTEGMCAVSELAMILDDPNIQPVLNVHDDLTYEEDDDGLEVRIDAIAAEMCKPRFSYINVPLIVEVKIGTRWSELSEYKVYRSNEIFGTPNPYKD